MICLAFLLLLSFKWKNAKISTFMKVAVALPLNVSCQAMVIKLLKYAMKFPRPGPPRRRSLHSQIKRESESEGNAGRLPPLIKFESLNSCA